MRPYPAYLLVTISEAKLSSSEDSAELLRSKLPDDAARTRFDSWALEAHTGDYLAIGDTVLAVRLNG
jgi:hypothetical protein